MSRSTLEWYELLARGLIWAGAIVLGLGLVAAVVIAGSDNALPVLQDVERQGRGIAALAALAGGITSAGLLAGAGALLRLVATDRLEKLPHREESPAGANTARRPELFDNTDEKEQEPPSGRRGPVSDEESPDESEAATPPRRSRSGSRSGSRTSKASRSSSRSSSSKRKRK